MMLAINAELQLRARLLDRALAPASPKQMFNKQFSPFENAAPPCCHFDKRPVRFRSSALQRSAYNSTDFVVIFTLKVDIAARFPV